MLSREGFSQLSRGSRCNLREIVTVSRSLDVLKCLAARSHLRWHQPWLPNGTVHLQKEKWWHYLINLKRTWKNLSASSSNHCCHWTLGCCHCHILQEYRPVSCAKVCRSRHWSHFCKWQLHPWDFPSLDPDSLLRVVSSGGYWSQGWASASHRGS